MNIGINGHSNLKNSIVICSEQLSSQILLVVGPTFAKTSKSLLHLRNLSSVIIAHSLPSSP